MDPGRFDAVSKLFANRRLSHRQVPDAQAYRTQVCNERFKATCKGQCWAHNV